MLRNALLAGLAWLGLVACDASTPAASSSRAAGGDADVRDVGLQEPGGEDAGTLDASVDGVAMLSDAGGDGEDAGADEHVATAADFLGDWAGIISVPGGREFRIILRIAEDGDGEFIVTLDSPDQGAYGIPGRDANIDGSRLQVGFPLLGAGISVAREGDKLVGLFSQGATLPVQLMPTVIPPFARPQEAALVRDYEIREVTFDGGAEGVTLAGELTLPEGNDGFPAVVLVSGADASNRDMELFDHRPLLVLADHLTQAGIATLRYDNRGVGQSTGDNEAATPEDFATDAAAALRFLRAVSGVDATRTGILGHTDGGLAAVLAGEAPAFNVLLAMPTQPAFEVLMRRSRDVGALQGTPEEVLDQQASLQSQLFEAVRSAPSREQAQAAVVNLLVNAGLSPQRASDEAEGLTRPWLLWILDYDPLPALRAVQTPVLALYGDKDLIVAADANAPDMEAALDHSDSSVQVLPKLNHFFQPATTGGPGEYADIETTFDPAPMDIIAEWIADVTM